jgi:hypothetical protein
VGAIGAGYKLQEEKCHYQVMAIELTGVAGADARVAVAAKMHAKEVRALEAKHQDEVAKVKATAGGAIRAVREQRDAANAELEKSKEAVRDLQAAALANPDKRFAAVVRLMEGKMDALRTELEEEKKAMRQEWEVKERAWEEEKKDTRHRTHDT